MQKIFLVDCHTHTDRSHDSNCPPEEACEKAIEHGLDGIAFTDHCDVEYCREKNLYEIVKSSVDCALEMREKFKGRLKVYTGTEISETLFKPDEARKLLQAFPYDIVIGSVHAVRYKNFTYPYSRLDFSALSPEDLHGFLTQYFDDLSETIDNFDFDVLAHLTCPLRYVNGTYKLGVDGKIYAERIEQILRKIIKKGVALEVNTSNFAKNNGYDVTMPDEWILALYKSLGGELLTLASDAHAAKYSAIRFLETLETLKKLGFQYIHYYENRTPIAVPVNG